MCHLTQLGLEHALSVEAQRDVWEVRCNASERIDEDLRGMDLGHRACVDEIPSARLSCRLDGRREHGRIDAVPDQDDTFSRRTKRDEALSHIRRHGQDAGCQSQHSSL